MFEEEHSSRPSIGRPRPEPQDLLTARQLAYAYAEARTQEDRDYALEDAEGFLGELHEGTAPEVLVALLGLPADEDTREILHAVHERLMSKGRAAVPALLHAAALAPEPLATNAGEVLDRMPPQDLAAALLTLLAREHNDRVKGAAAGAGAAAPSAAAGRGGGDQCSRRRWRSPACSACRSPDPRRPGRTRAARLGHLGLRPSPRRQRRRYHDGRGLRRRPRTLTAAIRLSRDASAFDLVRDRSLCASRRASPHGG